MPMPFQSARLAATVAAAATVLILGVFITYESSRVPVLQVFRTQLPLVCVVLVPLLVVLWRLRNGPDAFGFAIGFAFALVIFGMLLVRHLRLLGGNSDLQMEAVLEVMLFWARRSTLLFVAVFLPALAWLLVESLRGYRSVPANGKVMLLTATTAGMAIIMVYLLTVWPSVARAAIPTFRADQSRHVLERIYRCLWQFAGPAGDAGFPRTLAELETDPRTVAGCGAVTVSSTNETHIMDYRPGARTFTLSFTERVRHGARAIRLWVDESGVVRQTVLDAAGSEIVSQRRILGEGVDRLVDLLRLDDLLQRHARAHPATGYPNRIAAEPTGENAGPHVLILGDPFHPCQMTARVGGASSSCVIVEHRVLVYTPVTNGGPMRPYTLSLLPPRPETGVPRELKSFRSYFRDETGVIHGTGAFRVATQDDPPLPADELTTAQQRLARWLTGIEEDQRLRAAYDSARRTGN